MIIHLINKWYFQFSVVSGGYCNTWAVICIRWSQFYLWTMFIFLTPSLSYTPPTLPTLAWLLRQYKEYCSAWYERVWWWRVWWGWDVRDVSGVESVVVTSQWRHQITCSSQTHNSVWQWSPRYAPVESSCVRRSLCVGWYERGCADSALPLQTTPGHPVLISNSGSHCISNISWLSVVLQRTDGPGRVTTTSWINV